MTRAPADKDSRYNRLIHEKSPYLLQHAANPVDWYAWGTEAFQRAAEEDKPIFLSIGYSTCHWCHVMETESFEDQEVASLLNETFVCIKVDREERPDIDLVYMEVCQMMAESCGWPLTIMMTQDKKPFFAATYISKEGRFGHMGMLSLVPKIKEIWEQEREKVLQIADKITLQLNTAEAAPSLTGPGPELLKRTFDELRAQYDDVNGGFGHAPKFPTPHRIFYLLRYWKRTGNDMALAMVEKTLAGMRNGGIYDHVGFGFHRYSTDAKWLLPHFEKMLYDQALLCLAYTETYQATGRGQYRETAQEILSYVLRDMTSELGGFYSAEDADSQGIEGLFNTWTLDEIKRIVGADADILIKSSAIQSSGNFIEQSTGEKTGRNIIYRARPVDEVAAEFGLAADKTQDILSGARIKLFSAQQQRPRPHKDDKILADWNGLIIAAFAKAGAAFGHKGHVETAKRAADFILSQMRNADGRLFHRFRDGEAAVTANAGDYAFVIWGLIELYEATLDINYLNEALALNSQMLRYFWDEKNGGFYFTASDSEDLIARKKEFYDGAVPSGNSVGMLNLLRLGRLSGDPSLEKLASLVGKAFVPAVETAPSAYTHFMCAADSLLS